MLYLCAKRVMEEITTALRMIQGSLHSITFFFSFSANHLAFFDSPLINLQFHLSSGWYSSQNGSLTGSVSFLTQYSLWLSGSFEVVDIHRRLGRISLLRSNSRQSAAVCARITAVSYSVCSHEPT